MPSLLAEARRLRIRFVVVRAVQAPLPRQTHASPSPSPAVSPAGSRSPTAPPAWSRDTATPCAWLPALAATTPRAASSAVSSDKRFSAPRSLKLPVICRFSSFRYTVCPGQLRQHLRSRTRRHVGLVPHPFPRQQHIAQPNRKLLVHPPQTNAKRPRIPTKSSPSATEVRRSLLYR